MGAWRAMKNLSGGEWPDTGKAIVYRGQRCTTDRAKANAFNQEYAQVSGRKSTKESRKMAVQVAKRLRNYSTKDPAEADFTEAELDAALGKVKPRKAAGLDGVGSDYVKSLTSKARRWFLTLINESRRRGWILQAWKSGLVIPILKKGKPPEVLDSYRPITLLANLRKMAERMVAERLTWWLEGRGAIDQAQEEMTRSGIMGRLAEASWGWSKESMRVVYQATQRSVAEYAAPAWAPWLSETSRQNLERAQLKAARHITGNIASTPTQLVLKEAGLPSLEERHEVGSVALLDRWMHLPEGDLRRAVAEGEVQQRTGKLSWRHKSRASLEQMDDLGVRGVDVTSPVDARPPWSRGSPIRIRRAQVTKNDTEEVQLEKAREAVDALGNPDVTVYTDGSVVDGTRTGGAGVVVRTGDETIRQWSVPAGARCSSYAAELTAMLEAATWLKRTQDWRRAAIVTDSRSLVDALGGETSHHRLETLRRELKDAEVGGRELVVLWVPSHCGLEGNELADERAKEGTTLQQAEVPLDQSTRRAVIREEVGRRYAERTRDIDERLPDKIRDDEEGRMMDKVDG